MELIFLIHLGARAKVVYPAPHGPAIIQEVGIVPFPNNN
jgi:hypothetical protein